MWLRWLELQLKHWRWGEVEVFENGFNRVQWLIGYNTWLDIWIWSSEGSQKFSVLLKTRQQIPNGVGYFQTHVTKPKFNLQPLLTERPICLMTARTFNQFSSARNLLSQSFSHSRIRLVFTISIWNHTRLYIAFVSVVSCEIIEKYIPCGVTSHCKTSIYL